MKRLLMLVSLVTVSVLCAAPVLDGDATVLQDPLTALVTIRYAFTGEPAIVTVDIQTNGPAGYASIDNTYLTNLVGDVNKKIAPGSGKTITWQPADTIPGRFVAPDARAVVTLHATNSPPDYIVLDLSNATAAGAASVRFFPNAAQIPLGVTNNIYKTRYYVMRRIHAAGIVWPMGAADNEAGRDAGNERLRLWVALPEDYYMGIYEVTQGHFGQNSTLNNNSDFKNTCKFKDYEDSDCRPVNSLTYVNTRGGGGGWPNNGHTFPNSWAYLQYMRNQVGPKFLLDLPTEAQWEFACRAGNFATRFYSGDTLADLDEVAWYATNTVSDVAARPVGLKKPNAWGLYDMLGNVREICLDNYRVDYGSGLDTYDDVDFPGPVTDFNGEVKQKVLRGGYYASPVTECRSAFRQYCGYGDVRQSVGFRLAMQVVYPY